MRRPQPPQVSREMDGPVSTVPAPHNKRGTDLVTGQPVYQDRSYQQSDDSRHHGCNMTRDHTNDNQSAENIDGHQHGEPGLREPMHPGTLAAIVMSPIIVAFPFIYSLAMWLLHPGTSGLASVHWWDFLLSMIMALFFDCVMFLAAAGIV